MAANDRILIEIVTAANLAGIEQAKAGILGMNVATVALATALAAGITVGKAALENYKDQQEALESLRQASNVRHRDVTRDQQAIESFIQTNKSFISNQYDVVGAYAALLRAGYQQSEALRILNDALDLATIKHEDVSEAGKQLTLVLAGNGRALRELGITTDQYNAIMHSKTLTTEQKHAALLALIEQRTKKGRLAQDELQQSQHRLNIDWQNFTAKIGPSVEKVLDDIVTAADRGVDILTELYEIIEAIIKSPGKLGTALSTIGADFEALTGGNTQKGTGQRRASGGPVSAGDTYLVGEQGPELLVMGGQSGTVIPNGGSAGGGYHVHVHIDRGAFIDGPSVDRLANLILQRARYASGK